MKRLLLLACLLAPAVGSAQIAPRTTAGPKPLEWSVSNVPSSATAATIGKAAKTGTRHVATGVTVCIVATANQASITFNLRDGATGAGTVLWSVSLAATVGLGQCVMSPPMNVVGTANTAMTLESAAAPATNNFATVSLTGYDI